jgi:predicted nucleic acid-binding protein
LIPHLPNLDTLKLFRARQQSARADGPSASGPAGSYARNILITQSSSCTTKGMEIVSDASAFLAVVLDEEDRKWVIEKTSGSTLISPEVLPYEISNALTAMRKKGRLKDREARKAFNISQSIPVRLVPVRIYDALKVAIKFNIYAYEAFYVRCCLEAKLPLISLDKRMCEVAKSLSIKVVA